MANERPVKDNHLIYADAVGSRGKSGVWFGEEEAFKKSQEDIMSSIKDKVSSIPLENAVIVINVDPPGVCVIAPNPSLPGIMVLADGATQENTNIIKDEYIKITKGVISTLGLDDQLENNKA